MPDSLFCVRTITAFVNLERDEKEEWESTITAAAKLLSKVETSLSSHGYVVQTIRIATNPFGEWLPINDDATTTKQHLVELDRILEHNHIHFCSLGKIELCTFDE